MLTILGHGTRACDGVTRRELMRVAALSLAGGWALPRFSPAAHRLPLPYLWHAPHFG